MRVTIDLMKKSTQIIDLSNVINPRVGDDDLLLPLHIIYGDNQTDMRGKDVEFLSNDPNKKNIYIAGTCNTNTPGDNLYMGDLTFRFPAGTFKVDGTYDPDKTMFRIVDKETQKVISSVNVKITVMKNNIEFDFDPDKSSYDSRLETMLHDFHDKGQAMLDDIKDLNDQAKSNVSGDTAATAKEAKQQADTNAGDISGLKDEIAGARGRYADLPGREDAQDTAINQKETIANANANYAALKQKDSEQDVRINNKANQDFIVNYLTRMHSEPEGFTDLNALKSTYPNGKEGIMVTTDDGHFYLWYNGAWNDRGLFQGKGIANRSVDNLSLKEKTLTLRTSQSTPWIIDFDNRELTVSDASYFYDDQAYLIPKGVYSLSDYATVYVGYDTVTEKFGGYVHYSDMPESSYFMGSVDLANRKVFLQFDCIDSEMIPNGQIAKAVKMSRANLPAPATGLVSFSPWTVNVYDDTPTITVNGYASYVNKESIFGIKIGKYSFDKNSAGAYYIYLDLNYENSNADIKATDMPWNIPVNSPWIGFIETNNHVYRIFNNSNNTSYPLSLVTDERFTVDFQKGTLYVPVIWHTVNALKNGTPTNSGAEISFDKSQSALYVGMDPSQLDINKMFVFSPDISVIQNGYQYLGWISILTEEYDFGQYGSSRDLVLQPWLNRKVACLGDSITQGDSGEGSLIDSYVPRLKKYIGTNAQNFGKNGALITKKTDDDISFVNRVGAIEDQDVVTIFGGINDFQWNAPLGTMADGIDKPTTFFGALKYVITTLAANNPKAKLMLITPMKTTKFQYHTYDNNGNLMQNANGNTQLDFVNAIKQVGEYYSIPVLDMYSNSNYSPYLPSQVGHDNFTADGLHPTAHGYERIAQTIGHAINNL